MMKFDVSSESGSARVRLQGRLDYACQRDFRQVCESAGSAAGIEQLELDMGGVEYLDSSALGMLLLVRDKCKARNQRVRISNCRTQVMQILRVTNFDRLFQIQ